MSAQTTDRLEMHLTSEPAQIAPVRLAVEKFAAAAGLSDKGVGEVGLCLNEALANVMRHAYEGVTGKPISVTVENKNGELVVSIRDWGNGRNPMENAPKPYDPLEPGGLGLICLKGLMDWVTFTGQRDGMLLVMGKKVSGQ
jgi:serine/threonine-protein kinase RsbW